MQMTNVSNHTNKSTSKEINWSTHEHLAVEATLIASRYKKKTIPKKIYVT